MSKVEDFLTAEEENAIIEAIRKAERSTSGEIRIHLEKHTDLDILDRTQEVFHFLKMDNTELHNGVLIYIAVEDRKFAIYGDKGINQVVPEHFWQSTKEIIQSEFRKGQFANGLIQGVLTAGKELQKHFPWHHQDRNELPDEISSS